MNRFMVGIAMAALLAVPECVTGQTRARIDVGSGRVGASVVLRNLPVRVTSPHSRVQGWVEANWGPVRILFGSRPDGRMRGAVDRRELRYMLGKNTVKQIERHGKRMGFRGQTWGRWFSVDRRTSMLEVTMGGMPVAELYDYRNDGVIDEILLTQPPRNARYKERGKVRRKGRWPW